MTGTPVSQFVHLHVHSEYSLLDSSIRVGDLLKKAKSFGMPGVSLTDHGNMFGAIEFYMKAKKEGINPILGSEIYFTYGSRFDREPPKILPRLECQDELEARHEILHLVLICKNNLGYQSLCSIISQAYLEGMHGRPRADFELLKEFREGLICITSGPMGVGGYSFWQDQDEKAKESLLKLKEIFGDDFYIGLHSHGLPEEKKIFEKSLQFAKENNITYVATNDCHYLEKEDHHAQEVLMCAQTKKTLGDEDRMKFGTEEFYFKSEEEMAQRFKDYPEALTNTLEVHEKCNIDLEKFWLDENRNQIYHLPHFEITTGESQDDYFRRFTHEGLEKRFQGPHFLKLVAQENWQELRPQYIERLDQEIELIIEMGFVGYFLIVADFIQWTKDHKIPVGPGRGSGAGSLVAYALQITNINPLPFNLLFERFINPERISMPDFDIDFCQQRRGEVIDYVTEKYGKERVGQIVTFGKLQAKAALKDVARVFAIPFAEADGLSKLIPDELGITLEKALDQEPKIKELMDTDPKIRSVVQVSRKVEGLNRHASIHAAGVIITSEPLVHYCPLLLGAKGEQVIQFDKNYAEDIGLVKFDFLGLKTLTVIDYASKLIQREFEPDFDIEEIDLEDSEVYGFIGKGETVGVFQLESSGMIDLCKRINPDSLDDITAINALYRPGPMESGMVDDFVEIKNGRKEPSFPFPELEAVLTDTLGVIVYQEQVMNVARIVASYSLGQADMLRRAMGKKKVEEMDRHKEIFRKGAIENGFDEKIAVDLFDKMAKFAAYGFNKSHAVAYALIAYQTAYLKYYYPACFFAGLLSTELTNTDKVTAYINDTKRYDIKVLPPDVNESLWHFNVVEGNIRFALGAVKNVGENAVQEIIRERTEGGPFVGFIDFCERVDLRQVNKRTVESLIKVGGFDSFEIMNRKTLLEHMEKVMAHGNKISQDRELGQSSLFDMLESEDGESLGPDVVSMLGISEVSDFEESEKLEQEYQLLGIYVSGHPLDPYADTMKELSSMSCSQVQEIVYDGPKEEPKSKKWVKGQKPPNKKDMVLSGLIAGSRTILTKKGDKMAFATLEDLSGKIECIVFPKVYAEYQDVLRHDGPVLIEGYVDLLEEPRKMFPNKMTVLEDHADEKVSSVQLQIPLEGLDLDKINRLKQVIQSFRGAIPVGLYFKDTGGLVRMPLGNDYQVDPNGAFTSRVNEIFKENCVKLIFREDSP